MHAKFKKENQSCGNTEHLTVRHFLERNIQKGRHGRNCEILKLTHLSAPALTTSTLISMNNSEK
jgi:hypothetical protein